jgi:hypothetical protein
MKFRHFAILLIAFLSACSSHTGSTDRYTGGDYRRPHTFDREGDDKSEKGERRTTGSSARERERFQREEDDEEYGKLFNGS